MIFALALGLPFKAAFAGRALASDARPNVDTLAKAKTLGEQGQVDEAVKLMTPLIDSETDRERRGLSRMTLGLILFRNARDNGAIAQFQKAIEDDIRISDYANYYLALLHAKTGQNKQAQQELEKVLSSLAPLKTEQDARLALADIMVQEKQWKPAAREYEALRRKMRSSPRYPEILFNLVRTERKAGNRTNSCKWARELYAKFPSHPLVHDWGQALNRNTIDGETLGCLATREDLKTRVRRLWLGGESERAASELEELRKGANDEGEEEGSGLDFMLANHLLSDGLVDEAMKLLTKHYKVRRGSPNYLMLLAKAASRAGENQAAIAAYQRAYEIAPRGKNGTNAFFSAAFTSYQIQDYDGATRKFEQFIKRFSGSRLASDARWYLAWMRYLKADYAGAYESLAALGRQPKRRRGRSGSESLAADRLKYWSAMSLVKLGRVPEAVPLFQSLVRDPSLGYYSVVAYYRLLSVPGAKLPPGIEARLGLKKGDGAQPTEEELQAAADAVEAAKDEFADNQQSVDAADESGDDQEDTADETGQEQTADAAENPDAPTVTGVVDAATEELMRGFKDPKLALRFERARDLVLVGLEDSARNELREIEKRARSAADRRTLMLEYSQVRTYDRSSYIGDVGFGVQRIRDGLRGESRQLWEFAYPRAYETAVQGAAKTTAVPEELIWGIMRAESHFKSDVQSPVGALGLMQMMPFTGRKVASLMSLNRFETHSLLDPETNIRLGSRYLQRLFEKFSGSVPLVAAGYNAGPHRVYAWMRNFGMLDMDAFIEHIPFVETRDYVKRVTRNYQIYSLLYSGGNHSLRWLVQPVGLQLSDNSPSNEVW